MSTCEETTDHTCAVHGCAWTVWGCLTAGTLETVSGHRAEQFRRWGANRDVADGTGPDVQWFPVLSVTATQIEEVFRLDWDYDVDTTAGERTWMRMLREEVAEAFAEEDPRRLYAELTQVAALAVSWMEKIAERGMVAHDEWKEPK